MRKWFNFKWSNTSNGYRNLISFHSPSVRNNQVYKQLNKGTSLWRIVLWTRAFIFYPPTRVVYLGRLWYYRKTTGNLLYVLQCGKNHATLINCELWSFHRWYICIEKCFFFNGKIRVAHRIMSWYIQERIRTEIRSIHQRFWIRNVYIVRAIWLLYFKRVLHTYTLCVYFERNTCPVNIRQSLNLVYVANRKMCC